MSSLLPEAPSFKSLDVSISPTGTAETRKVKIDLGRVWEVGREKRVAGYK